MSPQVPQPVSGVRPSEYQRLMAALAHRAKRLGSRDPESAAQESFMRSVENPVSRPAMEFYFGENAPADRQPPEWPLDRLFMWLHAVLSYVVREEQSRAGFRRETSAARDWLEPVDSAPGQLDALIREELHGIVAECFPALDRERRRVLRMRVDGMKYEEIATRLGVNENTVATWVSRGIRDLAQRVRRRMERR